MTLNNVLHNLNDQKGISKAAMSVKNCLDRPTTTLYFILPILLDEKQTFHGKYTFNISLGYMLMK